MKSMRTLTTFLGWCTVINISLLIFAGFGWFALKDHASGLGAEMFGVSEADIKTTFLLVLLQYRTGIFLFNLVPWIALKVMARTGTPDGNSVSP